MGIFACEGMREVSRALQAGLTMCELYFCPAVLGLGADEIKIHLNNAEVDAAKWYEVDSAVFIRMTYRKEPEGILAIFEQRTWQLKDLDDITPPELWLVCVGATKPGNVGAMARSALAAGASGMLLADAVVDTMNPNAIRASTGAVFSLPIVCQNTQNILSFLADRQVRILAAEPGATRPYFDVPYTDRVALVIGSEPTGLNDRWKRAADELITIPFTTTSRQTIDSLNAATTAGILLFEVVRQHQSHHPAQKGGTTSC